MKPHIRMINGRWCCCGATVERYAATPLAAYWAWWGSHAIAMNLRRPIFIA